MQLDGIVDVQGQSRECSSNVGNVTLMCVQKLNSSKVRTQ